MKVKLNNKKYNSLIIRFKRKGHIYYPLYEIVLIKKKTRRGGTVLERLGFFNPNSNARILKIDSLRMAFWLNRGAKVHTNVKKYLIKFLV